MDPVLTDCYVWLYDQAEYVAMALHTWHQLGQEVPRNRFVTVMSYVLKYGRDPPPSLQLLPDEPLSPAHQQGLHQQLQGSPTQQHGSSAVSLLREGVGSRGSGLMDLMLLRRVSSLASSTSSLFQEGGSLSTPLSSHSSYGGAVKEGMRVALVSVLCDLSQVPFLNVSLSAMVGEGRLPELFPFQGYGTAFRAILAAEGVQGLFTGWVWVCGVGLCENFSLLHAQLQGDEDEPEEEEEEDDTSVLTHPPHHPPQRRQDDDHREGRQGRPPIRMRDYQALLETTTAALQAEVQWVSGGVLRLWQCLTLKAQPSPNGNPQIPPNTDLSLRPSPYSSTSLVSHHHHHHTSRRSHSWLTQGWRNPATVVSRACKALLCHPLPLLALQAITHNHGPQHIRRECGGWGGLWSGAYTSIFMALYREPLLCLFSAPFVIRSRRMLLLNKTGSASAALGAAAVPLLGRQTLGLLTTILKQDGLLGVWSGSRALLWGLVPSMACCLVTRLCLKLVRLADSPRKTRRDRRRVEYIKYLARQWDWDRPPPSSPSPSSPSYPHNGPSLGDGPIEPLDGHYRPFAAQPLPPPSLSHSSGGASTHGGGGRGLLSSRHHHQHLPLQPPPSTPGLAPPAHGETTPLTANVGLSLSPEGAYSVGSTGSLGIASQPSPYVTTQLTRSGPMDGSGGYDADMSNSTASNTH